MSIINIPATEKVKCDICGGEAIPYRGYMTGEMRYTRSDENGIPIQKLDDAKRFDICDSCLSRKGKAK